MLGQNTVITTMSADGYCLRCGHYDEIPYSKTKCGCDCHEVYYGDSRDDIKIEKN